jgi:hypothetical protein
MLSFINSGFNAMVKVKKAKKSTGKGSKNKPTKKSKKRKLKNALELKRDSWHRLKSRS